MIMKKLTTFDLHGFSALLAAVFALIAMGSTHAQTTGWNQTAGGTYDYKDTANWVGGTINGIWDASLTLTGAQTIQFSADTILSTALDFQAFGSQNIVLQGTGGAKTITLGGDITSNISINKALTVGSNTAANNLNVDLGGVTRTFTAGSSKNLNFQNVISNGGVTTYGGTVTFYGVNTYTGATTVNSGILSLNGASGSVADSNFTVNATTNSTNLLFNSSGSASTGITRAKSVTLNGAGGSNGAIVTAYGNSGANSIDTVTNAITAVEGYGIVGISANGTKNAQLTAGSFSREAGSSVLFRGLNLGVNTLASQTAGASNISFTAAPTLSGSGSAGTTTVGILSGAYGDSSSNSGDGKTGGLVTYDSTYGVRLLSGSEYQASITDGQGTLDNILLVNSAGTGIVTTALASATTVNSLSLSVSGADAVSGSGITISGAGLLKISSGAIYASQQVTGQATGGNAANAMTLSIASIDLNGQEGSIIVFTNGVNNGNTAAPLYISSVISNDGGKGVTFGGTGETILNGADANSYTGVTTINSGILRLAKTTLNTGLTTDLVLNGGALLKNSNAIADTASVTINGGTFYFDTTTSSGNNGHQETINNFTMNGGGVANHGTGASFTINGNANLNAGNLIMNQGGDIIVAGTTTLNGGVLTARESTSTTVYNGLTSLSTVSITNTANSAYSPIVLTSHATNKGAQLTLNGDLTFTGNGINTNTALINTSDGALANQGVIALNGTRTFNVGNGAAAIDLAIIPTLQDGASTGGLTKTGLGSLSLNGASTYTGATTVTVGTLVAANDKALGDTSSLSVNGGNLDVRGTGTTGTLTLGTAAAFSLSSGTVKFELGTAFDQLVSSGAGAFTITGGTFALDVTGAGFSYANTYQVLSGFGGSNSVTNLGFTGYDSANFTADLGTNGVLSFTAVPESATWALLAFSLTTVLVLRRRRA